MGGSSYWNKHFLESAHCTIHITIYLPLTDYFFLFFYFILDTVLEHAHGLRLCSSTILNSNLLNLIQYLKFIKR